eukprot:CAMPEP_0175791212 /NCGR_PEP_ID=MMETSP0097-20121207/82321_1 /TAXON_ID=311494 /ORGANISM="Alexandrium monilatum, Strain CCMP3105" /LENGTH=57 /DNA_ID=CAMNT_0017102335 /DNA_START=46 /DNA_END=219 /DNA_ORIENTATION=+
MQAAKLTRARLTTRGSPPEADAKETGGVGHTGASAVVVMGAGEVLIVVAAVQFLCTK